MSSARTYEDEPRWEVEIRKPGQGEYFDAGMLTERPIFGANYIATVYDNGREVAYCPAWTRRSARRKARAYTKREEKAEASATREVLR